MAYTMRIRNAPEEVPEAYPPLDPMLPWDYYAKHVYMLMLMDVLKQRGALKGHQEWTGEPQICAQIADALLGLRRKPLKPKFFKQLRDEWNAYQDGERKEVAARGEILLQGCEPFPYTEEELHNDLLHFGVYNAIACQYGGYTISPALPATAEIEIYVPCAVASEGLAKFEFEKAGFPAERVAAMKGKTRLGRIALGFGRSETLEKSFVADLREAWPHAFSACFAFGASAGRFIELADRGFPVEEFARHVAIAFGGAVLSAELKVLHTPYAEDSVAESLEVIRAALWTSFYSDDTASWEARAREGESQAMKVLQMREMWRKPLGQRPIRKVTSSG